MYAQKYFVLFYIHSAVVGSDKEHYKTRSKFNFEWDRSNPIVLDATNDTIYHYTVWYWDKMKEQEKIDPIEDDYLVEIPQSYKSIIKN